MSDLSFHKLKSMLLNLLDKFKRKCNEEERDFEEELEEVKDDL